MSSDICQIHLGPGGPQRVTVDSQLKKFRDEMGRSAVSAGGLVLDAAALKKHGDLLKDLRSSRFFSARDGSMHQADIRDDVDKKRARRWLSVTRDMMSPRQFEQACVQELYGGGTKHAGLGRYTQDTGVDHERFIREAANLKMRGLIQDLPDFDSDEAMVAFMGVVHDMAINEAQQASSRLGRSNRVIDAAPGLYLFSELLKRTEKLIEEDFTELWARRIFPILNLNTWLPQWMFQRIDDRTTLPSYVDIERLPSNAPRGSENRDAELRNLAFYHHAASWSKLELMRYAEAVANGAPAVDISRRRTNNAIRMMNFKEDLLTFNGDPDVNILGLFSPSAKTQVNRVPSATYGGPFGGGDAESDRNLLIAPVEAIGKTTEQVLLPDTIMLSTESWYYVNKTLYGTVDSNAGDNKTILNMSMETLEKFGIKDILWVPEVGYSAAQEARLKGHGLSDAEAKRNAGGDPSDPEKQAMVVCKRDPDVMEMVIAKDRTMYPAAETRTDRVETRMLQGSGGLAIYKPEGVQIINDVGPNP